jgi:hypothetical protein
LLFLSKILQNDGKSQGKDNDNSYPQNMPKLLDNLVEQYPNPIEFTNAVNVILDNATIDTNTRLNSLYYIGHIFTHQNINSIILS